MPTYSQLLKLSWDDLFRLLKTPSHPWAWHKLTHHRYLVSVCGREEENKKGIASGSRLLIYLILYPTVKYTYPGSHFPSNTITFQRMWKQYPIPSLKEATLTLEAIKRAQGEEACACRGGREVFRSPDFG